MLPTYKDLNKIVVSEIEQLQTSKLIDLLQYVNSNSKYYQSVFSNNSIDISEIKTLEDLQKVPVTTKDALYKYNKDFICVPSEKIIDYVTTSGTLGDPLTFILTEHEAVLVAQKMTSIN